MPTSSEFRKVRHSRKLRSYWLVRSAWKECQCQNLVGWSAQVKRHGSGRTRAPLFVSFLMSRRRLFGNGGCPFVTHGGSKFGNGSAYDPGQAVSATSRSVRF